MTIVRLIAVVAVCAAMAIGATGAAAQSREEQMTAAVAELREASFLDKEAIVERLVATGQPSVSAVLTAMLEDRLFARQSDGRQSGRSRSRRGITFTCSSVPSTPLFWRCSSRT